MPVNYDKTHATYMQDVHRLSQDVKGNKGKYADHYTQRNTMDPKYSQEVDEGRTHGNSPGWGKREDDTDKGRGYFGILPYKGADQPVGTISTEMGTSDPVNGKPLLHPLLVPTLTNTERDYLLAGKRGDKAMEASIWDKAGAHAGMRQAIGRSPFSQPGEHEHQWTFPEGETPYHKQQIEYQKQQQAKEVSEGQAGRFLRRAGGKDVTFDPLENLGPTGLAGAIRTKAPGWGAEVLRRYKLLGGTPETLNRTLTNRAMGPSYREDIVIGFRKGTDIATPDGLGSQQHVAPWDEGSGIARQKGSFDFAGDQYDAAAHRDSPLYKRLYSNPRVIELDSVTPDIESGTRGNAAYDAVSRQASRLMDQPGYNFKRPAYGPELSGSSEYTKGNNDFGFAESNIPEGGWKSFLRDERGSFSPGWSKPTPPLESGGFHVPTSKMMLDDPRMTRNVPGNVHLTEAERRGDYMFGRRIENKMADTLAQGPYGENLTAYKDAKETYKILPKDDQGNVDRVLKGRKALDETLVNDAVGNKPGGGSEPPASMRKRFGF